MIVTTSKGTQLKLEAITSGAQGKAFLSEDKSTFVKIYKRNTAMTLKRVKQLVRNVNPIHSTNKTQRRYWNDVLLWPHDYLTLDDRIGVVSNAYDPKEYSSVIKLFGVHNRENLPVEAKKWERLVHIAWRCAHIVEYLHSKKILFPDISRSNFVCNPATGDVKAIDLDSVTFSGVSSVVYGSYGYMAPEIHDSSDLSRISEYTDRYALTVLIFEILNARHPMRGDFDYGLADSSWSEIDTIQLSSRGIYTEHPTDTRNRTARLFDVTVLGKRLNNLFEKAFVKGLNTPSERPSAKAWRIALGLLIDKLVTCTNPRCENRVYPVSLNEKPQCPWCGTALKYTNGIPYLEIRDYCSTSKKSGYRHIGYVAGFHNKSLHEWHKSPRSTLNPFVSQKPIAKILYRPKSEKWVLKNMSDDTMYLFEKNPKNGEFRPK